MGGINQEFEQKMLTKKIKLPEYPRTEVKGKTVIIYFENGDELWEDSTDEIQARQDAHKIGLELKAIAYAEKNLPEYLKPLVMDLIEMGIPKKYLKNILCAAIPELEKYIPELDEIFE